MTFHTQTIHISESLYQRLNQQAKVGRKTVDEFAEQMLERVLPPAYASLQSPLEPLRTLSAHVLWQIARSEFPATRTDLYESLLAARLNRQLSAAESEQLTILRDEADQLLLRKSFAYALLRERGHEVPNPYDVTVYE